MKRSGLERTGRSGSCQRDDSKWDFCLSVEEGVVLFRKEVVGAWELWTNSLKSTLSPPVIKFHLGTEGLDLEVFIEGTEKEGNCYTIFGLPVLSICTPCLSVVPHF